MVKFIQIKRNYKIISMYPINPYIFEGWPEQTNRYNTYFNLQIKDGLIVDKYGKTVTNNGTTVINEDSINAISFNGTSNYIHIPNIDAVVAANGMFMSAVVKFNASKLQGICGKTVTSSTSNRYGLFMDVTSSPPNNIWGYMAPTGTATTNRYTFPSIVGKKIAIAMTNSLSGSTFTNKLYVNGVLVNTMTFTSSFSNPSFRYLIGAYGDAAGTGILANSYLNGNIYNVMQGHGTPNDADILALYEYQKTRFNL